MLFLVYSATNLSTIQSNLGEPEYSYFFVLKEYLPLLEKLGEIKIIHEPEKEVDAIYDACQQQGKSCIFLSFSPPHKTLLTLRCPTIPVFAWEFDTIPDEEWDNQPNNNWVMCLNKLGKAIVHSQHTVHTVKKQLGSSFPVISIPAPIWERFEGSHYDNSFEPSIDGEFLIKGIVIDSSQHNEKEGPPLIHTGAKVKTTKWQKYLRSLKKRIDPKYAKRSLITPSIASTLNKIHLQGIIYTSVFNPCDGRKNWFDMVTAFCTAFIDTPDAVLVLKFTHHDYQWAFDALRETFRKLRTFKCKVIAIHGFLNDKEYSSLITHSTYVVNTSLSEGQCLPLMEFLSSGKPAISPCHTAMEDYICKDVAFVINSEPELCAWPHDTRFHFRTYRHRISYSSLLEAYKESYHVAKHHSMKYKYMSEQCKRKMKSHCSTSMTLPTLDTFLNSISVTEKRDPETCDWYQGNHIRD
ncbi:glycosyltransferase [Legionella shakespearei]|uniref:Glycosyl transferases group 1 n=1 Tax=Legionella shakespearei DSM 23087 TaxID=1122169 RepID=A0A0W0YLE2_9GAMM|nr:glycosyltransferase [Legionella shakespearei]KTD57709.1 hypothetical protein Lsha_2550 [Legionella shakespearei DSM 23087]